VKSESYYRVKTNIMDGRIPYSKGDVYTGEHVALLLKSNLIELIPGMDESSGAEGISFPDPITDDHVQDNEPLAPADSEHKKKKHKNKMTAADAKRMVEG
jgi:hypothetical protein